MSAVKDEGTYEPGELLGVLGGMGPAATADFYARLVEATGAARDAEHVPVLIWADPRTPDRSQAILGLGNDPTPWLRRGARILRQAGATRIVVPCVSSHHFVRDVAAAEGLELIDLVNETAEHIARSQLPVVGLIATTGTVQSGLFQDALAARRVKVLTPDDGDQEAIMEAIRHVKAGRLADARSKLTRAAQSLIDDGVNGVVMGCTEVPLALSGVGLDTILIDPVEVVIERIVTDFSAR